MFDYRAHREAVAASMNERCGNDPQKQLDNICGYVLTAGGAGLDIKIPFYGICKDELNVSGCEMVLVYRTDFGFYWIRHESRNLRMGAEATLYIRNYHRRYLRAMNPEKKLHIDRNVYIPPQNIYLLEQYA